MFTLLLEFGTQASDAIKAAKDAADRDGSLPPEKLSAIVLKTTAKWKPVYKGREMLSPDLRKQIADALGQLAWNMSAAEKGRKVA